MLIHTFSLILSFDIDRIYVLSLSPVFIVLYIKHSFALSMLEQSKAKDGYSLFIHFEEKIKHQKIQYISR